MGTPKACEEDALRRLPIVIRPESSAGKLPLPPLLESHVLDVLHTTYTAGEVISHRGDNLVSMVQCFFSWGARAPGILRKLQDALQISPSLACIELARAYGYCDQPKSRYMEDFNKFLLHTLSMFQGEQLVHFRGYASQSEYMKHCSSMRRRNI